MADLPPPEPAPATSDPVDSVHDAIARWGAVTEAMRAAGAEAQQAKESAVPPPLGSEP